MKVQLFYLIDLKVYLIEMKVHSNRTIIFCFVYFKCGLYQYAISTPNMVYTNVQYQHQIWSVPICNINTKYGLYQYAISTPNMVCTNM